MDTGAKGAPVKTKREIKMATRPPPTSSRSFSGDYESLSLKQKLSYLAACIAALANSDKSDKENDD
jgi:hypothetical protein